MARKMLNFYHSSHDSIKSIFHVVKLVCLSLCVLNYTTFVPYFEEASKSICALFPAYEPKSVRV